MTRPTDCLWCDSEDGFSCFICGRMNGEAPRLWNVHSFAHPGAVHIGRGTPHGNPFHVAQYGREQAIFLFWQYARRKLRRNPRWLEPLRGKHLKCHCHPLPCHGEVLLYYLRRGH